MKQLNFSKKDPNMGDISGILRVDGIICYFKFQQSQQAQSLMENMAAKGAIITPGRKWIRVNIFGNNKEVILGREQFNVDDKKPEEVEKILFTFFSEKYTQAGFDCQVKELNSGSAED
jgi:hypothetical protein